MPESNASPLRQTCSTALYALIWMSFALLLAQICIDDWQYEQLRAHLAGVPLTQAWDDWLTRRSTPLVLATVGLLALATAGFRVLHAAATAARERRTAHQDPLTRLPNRRAFDQQLRALSTPDRLHASPASLLFIDLDGFKSLNDRHGHELGDRALISVAITLRDCLDRAEDRCCRWGGDEFVVLLPGTDREGALQVAERVLDALRDVTICVAPGRLLHVSGSIGVATLDRCVPDAIDDLPRLADRALSAAKRAGKGVVLSS